MGTEGQWTEKRKQFFVLLRGGGGLLIWCSCSSFREGDNRVFDRYNQQVGNM